MEPQLSEWNLKLQIEVPEVKTAGQLGTPSVSGTGCAEWMSAWTE